MFLQVWFYLFFLFLNMSQHCPFILVIYSPWNFQIIKKFPSFHSSRLNQLFYFTTPLCSKQIFLFTSFSLLFLIFNLHPSPGLRDSNLPDVSDEAASSPYKLIFTNYYFFCNFTELFLLHLSSLSTTIRLSLAHNQSSATYFHLLLLS